MCGIFGVIYTSAVKKPDVALLNRTAKLIEHRGPDGFGIYEGMGIGLVHTRLSLVDLNDRSSQPFWDSTGRYCLIYNGEIYNYKEIRRGLESKGAVFITTSDTEVLLQSLIIHGENILEELEGMFSFCFYDKKKNICLIARDRYGIKPLFFYNGLNEFIICSEIKALQPWVKLTADELMLSSYLLGNDGPTKGATFYKGIEVFTPGTYVKLKDGDIVEKKIFFDITDYFNADEHARLKCQKPVDVINEFDELLYESISNHMIADVPVGALCSGGVDSSLILAMASKISGNLSIFHANVKGSNSEYSAAKCLAKHLNLELKSIDVNDGDFIDKMPEITYQYGHPFIYHPNSVPFYMVAGLVKSNNVKAIMTGEAADESYLGYSDIPTENIFHSYDRLIECSGNMVRKIPLLGERLWPTNYSDGYYAKGVLDRFESELEKQTLSRKLTFNLSKNDMKSFVLMGHHLRTLMHRNDAMGMKFGIEARFPFLGHKLVRFAMNLPYKFKIRASFRGGNEIKHPFLMNKWVLRKVADRYLPKELSYRKKRGFPTNAYERMNVSREYFRKSFVAEALKLDNTRIDYLTSKCSKEFVIRLLHLDVWGRTCIENEDHNAIKSRLNDNVRFSK